METKKQFNLEVIKQLKNEDYIKNKVYIYKPLDTKGNFILEKNAGNSRHFPAAIKEWKNSTYSYNKNHKRNIASKDNMLDILIKSYFNFSNIKTRPRSRRMRSLRRKYTSKKIFVTKPDIKQTNDKVIVTLFVFNREKQFLLKKLFYYNRRRTILDMWRKNNNFIPFVEKYKQLNVLLKDKNTSENFNSIAISKTTINYIKNNRNIFAQFISKLTSKKEKMNLYYKIYNKISRNINKSSIFDKNNNNNFYLINKKKINRYKRKRLVRFKKNIKIKKKPWYVRKKTKRLNRYIPVDKIKGKKLLYNKFLSYSGLKYKNEMNFLSFKLLLKNKKLAYGGKLFYFYFLKFVLSMFNIKIYAFKDLTNPSKKIVNNVINTNELLNIEKSINKDKKGKRNKKSKFFYNTDRQTLSLYRLPSTIESKGENIRIYFYKINKNMRKVNTIRIKRTNKSINKFINISKPIIINVSELNNGKKIDNLDYIISNINYIISQFLNKVLIKSKLVDKERKLYILYKNYCNNYYKKFLGRIRSKQKLFSNYYVKLMINKFKFNKWLPNLKILISKIYNKKTELNIINLKYSHLNTDIYSNIISLKLRKKSNLLKVIRKALKLAKIPKEYKDRTKIKIDYDLNKMSSLNMYKSLKFKNLNKNSNVYNVSLQEILNRIYPRSMANNIGYISKKIELHKEKIITSKLKNVLNIIKYKTLSGIRIEAAGRLTRRYTASRAVFKFRYKGSLKNTDYSRIVENNKKTVPVVMLRNQVKANIQYSLNSSKRRVGSFGIKGWISGY